jgi:hypothetical protein
MVGVLKSTEPSGSSSSTRFASYGTCSTGDLPLGISGEGMKQNQSHHSEVKWSLWCLRGQRQR